MQEYFKNEIINGKEYVVPYNETISRLINKDYDDYKIRHITDCLCSEIYKVTNKDKKLIGKLCFNPDTKHLILHKFIKSNEHIMHTTLQLGINADIFKNLRVCDKIAWHFGNVTYTISVGKALKCGAYKNFKGSSDKAELQYFVNIEDLKKLEPPTKKRNVKKKKQKIKK